MKNNNEILFTIAIPTHNRPCFIDKNLLSLVKNNFFDLNFAELLISDNSTNLKTLKIVNKYQFKNLKYKKFANCTYKDNWLNCLNHSSGKYVLILGDDDVLDELFIKNIHLIVQKEFSLAIFKGIGYKNNIPTHKKTDLSLISTEDSLDFFKFAGTKITFISNIIINSHLLKNKHIKNEFNGNLVQLDYIFYLLKHYKKFLLINNYLVYAYVGNNSWGFSGIKLFSIDLNRYMNKYLTQNETIFINKAFLSSYFPYEIYKIRKNNFTFDKNILNIYEKYLLVNIFIYPLLVIPKFLLTPIAFLIIVLGKIYNNEVFWLYKKLKYFYRDQI